MTTYGYVSDFSMALEHPKTSGYVYFIRDGVGHIKIGIAQNVENRLKALQTSNACDLEIYKIFKVDSRYDAKSLEKELHSKFKKFRVRGEWFKEEPIIEWLDKPVQYTEQYTFYER